MNVGLEFRSELDKVHPKSHRILRKGAGIEALQFMIVKISPSNRQTTSTRPASTDSAPYLPALVASSWTARPMAWAAAAFRRSFGPPTAIRDPTRSAKGRELSTDQILQVDSLPLILHQQVLIGRKCLDALSETPDKVFRLTNRGLAGDYLHEAEHVLGAMIDLTRQKANRSSCAFRSVTSWAIRFLGQSTISQPTQRLNA